MDALRLIGSIACALGLHSKVRRDKWNPGIAADIVLEFEQTHTCNRCAKVLHRFYWRWDET